MLFSTYPGFVANCELSIRFTNKRVNVKCLVFPVESLGNILVDALNDGVSWHGVEISVNDDLKTFDILIFLHKINNLA